MPISFITSEIYPSAKAASYAAVSSRNEGFSFEYRRQGSPQEADANGHHMSSLLNNCLVYVPSLTQLCRQDSDLGTDNQASSSRNKFGSGCI